MSSSTSLSFGPGLLYFAIYAPSLSTNEGSEHLQILFYAAANPPPFSDAKHNSDRFILTNSAAANQNYIATNLGSPPLKDTTIFKPIQNFTQNEQQDSDSISAETVVSLETKLKHIGLAQALTSFSSTFKESDAPITIKTKKTITIVLQVEPGVWITLCVCLPRTVVSLLDSDKNLDPVPLSKTKKQYYSIDYNQNSEIATQLANFINLEFHSYIIINGPIALSTLPNPNSEAQIKLVKKKLRNYFSKVIWDWDGRWNNTQLSTSTKTVSQLSKKLQNNCLTTELGLLGSSKSIPRTIATSETLYHIYLLWYDLLALKPLLQNKVASKPSEFSAKYKYNTHFHSSHNNNALSSLDLEGLLIFNTTQNLAWSSLTDGLNSISNLDNSCVTQSDFYSFRSLYTYINRIFSHHFNSKVSSTREFTKKSSSPKFELGDSATQTSDENSSSDSDSSESITSLNNNLIDIPTSITGALSSAVTALVEPNKTHASSNIPFFQNNIDLYNKPQSSLVSKKAPPLIDKQNVLSETSTIKFGNKLKNRNHSVASLASIQSLSKNFSTNNQSVFFNKFNFASTPRLFTGIGDPNSSTSQSQIPHNQDLANPQSSKFETYQNCSKFTNHVLAPCIDSKNFNDYLLSNNAKELSLDINDIIWIRKKKNSQKTDSLSNFTPVHLIAIKFDQLLFVILINASRYIKIIENIQTLKSSQKIVIDELNSINGKINDKKHSAINNDSGETSLNSLLVELAWKNADLKSNIKLIKNAVSKHSIHILTHLKHDYLKVINQSKKCTLPTSALKTPLLFVNEHKLFALSNFNNISYVPLGYESHIFGSISPLLNYIPKSLYRFKLNEHLESGKTENIKTVYNPVTQKLKSSSCTESEHNIKHTTNTITENNATSSKNVASSDFLNGTSSINNDFLEASKDELKSPHWNLLNMNVLPTNKFGIGDWFKSKIYINDQSISNSDIIQQSPSTQSDTQHQQEDLSLASVPENTSLINSDQQDLRSKNADTKSWSLFNNFTKLGLNINLNPFNSTNSKDTKPANDDLTCVDNIDYSYFSKIVEQNLMILSAQFLKEKSLKEQFIKIPGYGWVGAKRGFENIQDHPSSQLDTNYIWYCCINSEKASLADIKTFIKQVSASYFINM
ncbi:hypothetical protein BB561_005365 [Smittium simulii]|uniref:CCZ1/INTU/HSP4 first Longin domain-containing protein n=1 Tax=Smittium simulii TaxID=133385 RepID=A0A2T9YAT1_9FUNG|nr:hypothetical protein BB561_005365 [Smittium simulii]